MLGQWMFLEGRRLGVPALVMSPLLVLTILLSPFGLLVFPVLRAARMPKSRPGETSPDRFHDAALS
ncbi:abscisic acid-deficient protein Aba4 family protein [Streptomyces sp. NPDC048411]|uniref:abscisic acid-deficient protein Aba4 family protein n=1 Tax=Streptomyces sp. NPDC048411 TaxID=3157206 RepID=UPI0034544609